MKPLFRAVIIAIFALSIISPYSAEAKTKRSKALIISGQNNHNWQVSHRVLKLILEQSGLFECDIMLTATAGGDMSSFTPNFEKYDVVVLDYNGDRWPKQTDEAFLQYVKRGGGVVVYHAADNAFAGWEEFNRIIALGGWEGRNEKSGPYYYLVDGKPTLSNKRRLASLLSALPLSPKRYQSALVIPPFCTSSPWSENGSRSFKSVSFSIPSTPKMPSFEAWRFLFSLPSTRGT